MQTVLIIEDEAALREDLGALMRLEGFRALCAGDGREGLDLALENRPDLVLLDLMLPDMDGIEVLRRIKCDERLADTPVIIASARGDDQDVLSGLELAEEYVTKPFSLPELRARVNSLLRLKKASEEIRSLNRTLEERVDMRTRELVISNQKLEQEVARRIASERLVEGLTERLLTAREEERARMAEDLHDELGQQIVALKWRLQAELARLRAPPDSVLELVNRVDRAAETLRELAREQSPIFLKKLGIRTALEHLLDGVSRVLKITADLEAVEGFFPENWSIELYRIVQESLANVMKHAGSTQVWIDSQRSDARLSIRIRDNGRGLADSQEAFGIMTMRRRAAAIGAQLDVRNLPDGGTEVLLEIPAPSA